MDHTKIHISLSIPLEVLKESSTQNVFVLFHISNVSKRSLDLLRSKFHKTIDYGNNALVPIFMTKISDYELFESFLHFMKDHASVGNCLGELVYRKSENSFMRNYFLLYDCVHPN